jgi:hypothetical protein
MRYDVYCRLIKDPRAIIGARASGQALRNAPQGQCSARCQASVVIMLRMMVPLAEREVYTGQVAMLALDWEQDLSHEAASNRDR